PGIPTSEFRNFLRSSAPIPGQYVPNFKNNDGSQTACSVKFSLTPISGVKIMGEKCAYNFKQ
ncbi:hypothetical protein GPALN_012088, partial [Globodera pallida]